MGKGRTGWRPKKNRKPDQALYVPRGRFGGRGNNMAGDMSRKSQKEEEKREETEKPGDVHLQVVESVGEGENLEKGEENELGEGCAERERKISIEDEVEITSAVQTTEESEKRVKCLKAEEEKQKENEEDMQTERTDHGEENQPRSGDINATKQNSELCESRRAELHIIISPSGETQKLGAVMQPSELGSPESISEENRREPGDILLPERPAETTEGSLAECTDLPGPSEAKDSENKGTERNQGENKGENKQCAQNNKGDTCTIIGGHEAAVASEEAKSLLCDSYRQGDAQEEGISEPALDAASPAESGILQQIIKEIIANVSEKDVQIQPLLNDFAAYAEDQTDHGRFGHVIEIYGFSRELRTEDLTKPFIEYREQGGFQLQWVDQSHALGIFSSPEDAYSASCKSYPGMKFRPLSQGCHQSKMKAHECAEFHSSKERPQTDFTVAKRMLSRALGHPQQDGDHTLRDSK
ncbi:hypothetical protein XENTR_v10009589 [Xenopus tropicalis]|uniref:R3H and coiled-coil domain-containing protein 1 n=2 Tax=Xenopus tropicalis TaxID=8364 RepID=A0A8J0SHW7_XENTR|nr:R3H and coiled-coil domain-containing protein 1 [Xenopus tropicalis]KAE8619062.1 hypothetical protein XENTR_v10009589 [Xenopus tropicalis]KAE8619063.1 hypothetical protein XENTR_v10009589 [Xenopus tropicalis]|eukprot:XP_012814891.1 PREDICTED: R3H and coiled-coil domain-containing protein 1 [Xenopus tropicalis]